MWAPCDTIQVYCRHPTADSTHMALLYCTAISSVEVERKERNGCRNVFLPVWNVHTAADG